MKKLNQTLLLSTTFIFLLLASCSKDDSSPTPTATTTTPTGGGGGGSSLTINSTPQFKATIDGASVNYIAGANNLEEALGAEKSINLPNPTTAIYTTSLYSNTTSVSMSGLKIGTLSYTGSSVASDTEFDNFISVGSHSYSVDAANGVHISWYDAGTSSYWTTSLGSGNQTGSTFNITQVAPTNLIGNHYVKFIATFSCTLYNGSGSSKSVTNGTYVGYFENM